MGVRIALRLADDLEHTRASASGFDYFTLNEDAAKAFGIIPNTRGYHAQLWEVCREFYGRPPDWFHCFDIDKPLGGWDGYKKNGCEHEQVKVEKKAIGCRILSVKSEPSIFASDDWVNDSDQPSTYKIALDETVTAETSRTVSDLWSVGYAMTIGVEIGGEAAQAKVKMEETISFGYEHGQEETKGSSISKTVERGVETTLPPHTEVLASLMGSRGSVEVEVDFECRLTGDAMWSFAKKHLNGRRDHLQDINEILDRCHQPRIRQTKEIYNLGFVSDGKIVVANK